MITLIFGDDVAASREKLREMTNKIDSSSLVRIEGTNISPELIDQLETPSLFGLKHVVLVEQFLQGQTSKDKDALLIKLVHLGEMNDLYFWESKSVDRTLKEKYFKSAKIIECSLPVLLFKFLDSVGMLDNKHLVKMFHEIIKTKNASFLYVMLLSHWRNIILAVSNLGISSGLPSWKIAKLSNQGRRFSFDYLVSSYRQLLSFDYKIKSGQTPFSMEQLLDIFFLTL